MLFNPVIHSSTLLINTVYKKNVINIIELYFITEMGEKNQKQKMTWKLNGLLIVWNKIMAIESNGWGSFSSLNACMHMGGPWRQTIRDGNRDSYSFGSVHFSCRPNSNGTDLNKNHNETPHILPIDVENRIELIMFARFSL